MKRQRTYRLVLGKGPKSVRLPAHAKRKTLQARPAKPKIDATTTIRALKATPNSRAIIARIPSLVRADLWFPTATFTVCRKTGTATWLDIWDCDHFDGFTDMQKCLADCRVWFSANGYTYWDSPQTKTGRINCYFKAPTPGNYVCNVQLQSYAGAAQVECLIDSFNYGPLPFNGLINQPHPMSLSAGYHSFRIRQMTGSFFFNSLTVWKT